MTPRRAVLLSFYSLRSKTDPLAGTRCEYDNGVYCVEDNPSAVLAKSASVRLVGTMWTDPADTITDLADKIVRPVSRSRAPTPRTP